MITQSITTSHLFPLYTDGLFHPVDTIRLGLPIIYFEGSQVGITKLYFISVIEDCCILDNSADPDEMLHFAASDLCLHGMGES